MGSRRTISKENEEGQAGHRNRKRGEEKNEGVDFLSDAPGLLSHEGFWLTCWLVLLIRNNNSSSPAPDREGIS
jgi:hypothetical protein